METIKLPPSSACLYSLSDIDHSLDKLAQQLNEYFKEQTVVVISVLTGGLVTTGHLLPKLSFPVVLDVIHATRYRNTTTGSDLEWKKYPSTNLKDKIVMLVDDIFDEGITLAAVKQYCLSVGAQRVFTVALTDKLHDRKVENFALDFRAMTVPDEYVFGFGLDYEGMLRNAPGIYTLTNEKE